MGGRVWCVGAGARGWFDILNFRGMGGRVACCVQRVLSFLRVGGGCRVLEIGFRDLVTKCGWLGRAWVYLIE